MKAGRCDNDAGPAVAAPVVDTETRSIAGQCTAVLDTAPIAEEEEVGNAGVVRRGERMVQAGRRTPEGEGRRDDGKRQLQKA